MNGGKPMYVVDPRRKEVFMKKSMNIQVDGESTKKGAEYRVKRFRVAVPIVIIGLMFIFTLAAAATRPLFGVKDGATLKGKDRSGSPLSMKVTQSAYDESITPPPVPTDIKVPAGNEP